MPRVHSAAIAGLLLIAVDAGAVVALDPTFADGGHRRLGLQPDGLDLIDALVVLPAGGFLRAGYVDPYAAVSACTDAGLPVLAFGDSGTSYASGAPWTGACRLADGRIIVASSSPALVGRLLADGSLDASFGSGGLSAPSSSLSFSSVAVAADGSVLAAGEATYGAVVARYTAAGVLDTSFGVGGIATVGTATADVWIGVAPGPGGTVLAGGAIATDLEIARFTTAGVLDGTFGVAGVRHAHTGLYADVAHGFAVDSDGSIMVCGDEGNSVGLLRVASDGTPDPGFGSSGVVTFQLPTAVTQSRAMLLDAGRAVIAVSYQPGGTTDLPGLVRLTAAGALDATFNGTGYLTFDWGLTNQTATALATLASGDYLVGGEGQDTGQHGALAWITPAGALDAAIVPGGLASAPLGSLGDFLARVVQLPGGGALVVGTSASQYPWDGDIVLTRLGPDGATDVSFGVGGTCTLDLGGAEAYAFDLRVMPDGRMLLTGTIVDPPGIGGDHDLLVARLLADGSLDATFNGTGFVRLQLGTSGDGGYEVALAPTGEVVVLGYTQPFAYTWAIVRLKDDGSVDTSFNGTGSLIPAFGSGSAVPGALQVLPDGRILCGGRAPNGARFDTVLVQYAADGSPDPTFNGGAPLFIQLGAGPNVAVSLEREGDGRILGCGTDFTGSSDDLAVFMLMPDGSADPSFNGGAPAIVDLDTSTTATAHGDKHYARMLADGSILIVACGYDPSGGSIVLARLYGDGVRDLVFGGGGTFTVGSCDPNWRADIDVGTGTVLTATRYDTDLRISRVTFSALATEPPTTTSGGSGASVSGSSAGGSTASPAVGGAPGGGGCGLGSALGLVLAAAACGLRSRRGLRAS